MHILKAVLLPRVPRKYNLVAAWAGYAAHREYGEQAGTKPIRINASAKDVPKNIPPLQARAGYPVRPYGAATFLLAVPDTRPAREAHLQGTRLLQTEEDRKMQEDLLYLQVQDHEGRYRPQRPHPHAGEPRGADNKGRQVPEEDVPRRNTPGFQHPRGPHERHRPPPRAMEPGRPDRRTRQIRR